MELSQAQTSHLMKRFPEFELSYETISHKNVSSKYDICMAIPTGKKCFAWFTFHQDKDVCYLLDLNRERKITKATVIPCQFDRSLSLGTIVYGTFFLEESGNQWFIIEDIFYFKGIPLKRSCFLERLGFFAAMLELIQQQFRSQKDVVFMLVNLWTVELTDTLTEYPTTIPSDVSSEVYYPIHHIQYRSCQDIMPYLNVTINKKIGIQENKKPGLHLSPLLLSEYNMDVTKPQYKYPTVFQVMADLQFDIYHLFAYGKSNQKVYYDCAYIPNYKTSVFMNSHFRTIRENKSLDAIEESDDEEDFQNVNPDKYVDLEKVLLFECIFHQKFKRWTPMRLVSPKEKVVHIGKLVGQY
jgi:hypothetical protein